MAPYWMGAASIWDYPLTSKRLSCMEPGGLWKPPGLKKAGALQLLISGLLATLNW